jgi:hypothetical protein
MEFSHEHTLLELELICSSRVFTGFRRVVPLLELVACLSDAGTISHRSAAYGQLVTVGK